MIPATGHVGDHVIEVLHGQFGFPYRNQEQSPEPDRPRFAIPFTVTPGAPVLPPPPDAQAQTHVRLALPHGELVSRPRFSGVGEPVTVSGGDVEAGARYTLNWTRVIGNRIDGAGWEASSMPVAEAVADASGRVVFTFETPDDLGGIHGLWLDVAGTRKLGTHFVKTDGVADGRRTRTGRHQDYTAPERRRLDRDLQHHAPRLRQRLHRLRLRLQQPGDVTIFMEATGAPGWHFIDLYPASTRDRDAPDQLPHAAAHV